MVTTLAIIGHNGNVGKRVLPHLIKAHQNGQIKLVVLHRPASAIDSIPADVERREYLNTDVSSLREVVGGINIILSTIGHEGFDVQSNLLDALTGSSDIVTFIPSSFGSIWTEEMLQKPSVRAFHEPHDRLAKKAKDNRIGFTQIRAGLFLDYTFMPGFMGLDAKANTIQFYKDALNKPFHITELGHLACAIVDVVSREPASIKDKNFYTYTFSPTGQDLIDLFTNHNGSEPSVERYTDEQYEQDTDAPGFTMVAATYKKRWERESGDGSQWTPSGLMFQSVKLPLKSYRSRLLPNNHE